MVKWMSVEEGGVGSFGGGGGRGGEGTWRRGRMIKASAHVC